MGRGTPGHRTAPYIDVLGFFVMNSFVQLLCDRLDRKDSGGPGFVCNAFADYSPEQLPKAMEWMALAQDIVLGGPGIGSIKMEVLNIYLVSKCVLVGNGTAITLADLGVFVSIRDATAAIPIEDQSKLPNFFRWFDYVQNKEDVRQVYELIPIPKPSFDPPSLAIRDAPKQANSDAQVSIQKPTKEPVPVAAIVKKEEDGNSQSKKAEPKKDKEKKEKPPAQKKEVDCDISVLDICVGQIKKVWRHPSADSLYVEEIDVGEEQPRQIVSGLVKYVSEADMLNRKVLVLLNVKPGKVRDVLSSGLVLCASNEDHTICEPVVPPEGASIGERVKFSGHDGKPEGVLNPKKKQWEKIAPELRTDPDGVANYLGTKFETSAGVCTSSIVNGSIK